MKKKNPASDRRSRRGQCVVSLELLDEGGELRGHFAQLDDLIAHPVVGAHPVEGHIC